MDLLNLNVCKKEKFSIKKNNENYILKYDNRIFVFDKEIAFKGCSIYTNTKPNKVKIHIENNNKEHEKFKKSIKFLYDTISEIIEEEDNINVDKIINPIYTKDKKDYLFIIINSNTIIKNFENEEIIKIDELYRKKFNIYPIIYSPNFNIYNDNIYINFTLHTIYIKEIENEWKNEILIDYEKIKKAMDKI